MVAALSNYKHVQVVVTPEVTKYIKGRALLVCVLDSAWASMVRVEELCQLCLNKGKLLYATYHNLGNIRS